MLNTFFTHQHTKEKPIVLGSPSKNIAFPKFTLGQKERKLHSYVVGLTGRGKSKFLQSLIVQDVLAGRGAGLIDPHGDLALDILGDLHSKGYFEEKTNLGRLVYVSPRRRDYVLPFNVLKRPDEQTETYEVAQRVIASFMRTWSRTLTEPPRFQQIMRSALAVLIEAKLPLTDLYRLLTDDRFKKQNLERITDGKVAADCKLFFENEFDEWGRDRPKIISSTTNKASALIENPNLYPMLSHPENHLDLRRIMDSGKILIVNLGDCDEESKRLIGSLLVTGFEHAALSRARQKHQDRRPFHLCIDEFQAFAHQPGNAEAFSQMLSQVRKYGLHLHLANQSLFQLPTELRNVMGNAQNLFAFRVAREDAEILASIFSNHWADHDRYLGANSLRPASTQKEAFTQHLSSLPIRKMVVKTADDRNAMLWAEKVAGPKTSEEELEQTQVELLKSSGVRPGSFQGKSQVKAPKPKRSSIFAT